jgi:acyl carrier protein
MRVEEIVAKTLGKPVNEIGDHTGPETSMVWDSASHIDILLSVEAEFGVAFSADEMLNLLSVGAIKRALAEKGAG